MTLFVASVALVLLMSAFCSISEAAIYAVRRPYIMTLVREGNMAGKVLADFKENMERPISAILIVNTVANTAGAALAGYQVKELFGESAMIWFTASFTLAVLLFSEIIPKTVGVIYARGVASFVALPWYGAIRLMQPFIWLVQKVTQHFQPDEPVLSAPKEEVQEMATMSALEGSMMHVEAELVHNVLRLNNVRAGEILTPRSVVVKLPESATIGEVRQMIKEWNVSRIPVYSDDPENWTGQVLVRDILTCMAKDQFDKKLSSLKRELFFVPETAKAHDLLTKFLRERSHLFGVLDEYGGVEGVVTLEDVIESVIGQEIVDELDNMVDMQEHARQQVQEREQSENDSDAKDKPAE